MAPKGESRFGALRAVVAGQLGSSFATKASGPLIAVAATQLEEGRELVERRDPWWNRVPDDGFIVECEGVGSGGQPDPVPGSPAKTIEGTEPDQFRDQAAELVSQIGLADEDLLETSLGAVGLIRSFRLRTTLLDAASLCQHDDVRRLDLPRRLRYDIAGAGGGGDPASWAVVVATLREAAGGDGDGVAIALIDGEIDISHPSLAGRCIPSGRYTPEGWGSPSNHATALAGLILGTPSVPGAAPRATVHNFKVMPTFGMALDDFALITALQDVAEAGIGIAICALSLDASLEEPERGRRAFERAALRNVVICKSAGNQGPNAATLTQPSGARGTLVAGACDRLGQRVTSYSSRGPDGKGGLAPDLLVPGGETGDALWSAHPGGAEGPVDSGTSNAAALTGGVLAALVSAAPGRRLSVLRADLARLGRPIAGVPDADQGVGAILVP